MILASSFTGLDGVRHGFFTRQGGVSEGIYASLNIGLGSSDAPDRVMENRARVAAMLGVEPGRLVTPYQIHSPDAVAVSGPWPGGEAARADAVVTATPGLAIGVSTADCGPVLFADAEAGVVGAAHAGWRGAFRGVLEETVQAMAALGARPDRIVAAIGPMISAEAYEVGPEFIARFLEADAENRVFFVRSERPGHSMFDLPGYIIARLSALGLAGIENLDLCTYADEARFYSFRRATHRGEADYGRLVSAIAIAA